MQPKLTNALTHAGARRLTLIELVTVLLIAGILTAIGVPLLGDFVAE